LVRIFRRIFVAVTVLNLLFVTAAFIVKKITPQFGDEDSDSFSVLAAMNGLEFASRAESLTTGEATAFLGGIELDLSRAHITGEARLEVRAIMGGIDVAVPADWRVEMDARSFAGDVQNATDPDGVEDDAPVLIVTADAWFGGVLIRAKKVEPVS